METASVGEWSRKWWEEVVLPKGLSSGALVKYEAGLKHLCREWGEVPLQEVRLSEFQQWFNALAQYNPNTGRPMAKSTLDNIRKVSRMVFRYADQNGVGDVPHFFDGLVLPKCTHNGRRALTSREVDAVLTVSHPAQSMAMVMLCTGLRLGECVPLRWQDLDLSRGVLRVTRSADLQHNAPRVHSGGKTAAARRLVPLPAGLIAYLKDWQKAQAEGCMQVETTPDLFTMVEKGRTFEELCGEEEDSPFQRPLPPGLVPNGGYRNPGTVFADDDLVFTNLSGNMHSKSSLRRMWQDYLRALNEALEKEERRTEPLYFTPHDLRHTYATMLYLRDVDIRDAMAYMGHATYQVTLGIYTDTEQYCRFEVDPVLEELLASDLRVPHLRERVTHL